MIYWVALKERTKHDNVDCSDYITDMLPEIELEVLYKLCNNIPVHQKVGLICTWSCITTSAKCNIKGPSELLCSPKGKANNRRFVRLSVRPSGTLSGEEHLVSYLSLTMFSKWMLVRVILDTTKEIGMKLGL